MKLIDLTNAVFKVQGEIITFTITPPSDKTLSGPEDFTYYYDLVYGFIQNSNDEYYYNDNFTSYLQKQPVMVNLVGSNYEANITIPTVNYDAAFKIVFYVKDDFGSGYHTSDAAGLIFYTFHTESRNMELIDTEWDGEELNIQVSQELSGPKLFDGIINADYWEKFADVFNAPYTTEFYLSKSGYLTPAGNRPSFFSSVGVTNSMSLLTISTEDRTGMSPSLTFSPDSGGTVDPNANVAATLITNGTKLKILYTITGLTGYYNNASSASESLQSYEKYYLVVRSYRNDAVAHEAILQATILPVFPLVQFKNQSVLINSKKTTDKTASLIINNPTTNTGYYDINLVSVINTEPVGIAFTDNTGSTYAVLKISKTEAEAWYDLIGHA